MKLRHRSALPLLLVTPLLVSCGGSGGGGVTAAPATTGIVFEHAVTPLTEGGSFDVAVVLRTAGGEPLDQELHARLADRGTGDATSGLDYAAISPVDVVFPAGTPNGARASIRVETHQDGVFEGRDERIHISLELLGFPIGPPPPNHVVRIRDHEVVEVSFLESDVTVLEDLATSHAVQVRLRMLQVGGAGEGRLGVPVEVGLRDTLQGSAVRDEDYALANQAITFEGPSADVVVTIPVAIASDGVSEPEEAFTLELLAEAPVVLSNRRLTVRVKDALDAGDDPLLVRRNEVGFTGGAVLELVASGGQEGLLALELTNHGTGAIEYGFPILAGDTLDFRLEQSRDPGFARAAGRLESVNERERWSWDEVRRGAAPLEHVRPGGSIELDGLEWPEAGPTGGTFALVLTRMESPLAPAGRIVIDGEEDARPQPRLFGGHVRGERSSRAFVSVTDGEVHAWVTRGGRTLRLGDMVDAGRVTAAAGGAPPDGPVCATLPGSWPLLDRRATDASPWVQPLQRGASALPTLRLAVETDRPFSEAFGNAQSATAYVLGMVGAANEILRRDVGIEISVVYVGLYEHRDPWNTEAFASLTELFNEFHGRWNGSGWPAEAELAHFLTPAHDGGLGQIGGYCTGSFSVSSGLDLDVVWGQAPAPNEMAEYDAYVFAHEIGHNLGAIHTHDYCPPLDHCAINCDQGVECSIGTLMSYCGICDFPFPGAGIARLELHPEVSNDMRKSADASCLPDARLDQGEAMAWRITYDPAEASPDVARARVTLRVEGATTQNLAFDLIGRRE